MDGLSAVFHPDRAIRIEISNEPAVAASTAIGARSAIGIEVGRDVVNRLSGGQDQRPDRSTDGQLLQSTRMVVVNRGD